MSKSTALNHPNIVAFLATLPPDAERDRVRQAYAEADAQRLALKERETSAPRELQEVDIALLTATGKARQELYARRQALKTDIETLPTHKTIVRNIHSQAQFAYLAAVRVQALAVAAAAQAELDPIRAEATAGRKALAGYDHHRMVGEMTMEEFTERAADVEARRVVLHAHAQPIMGRLHQATEVAHICAAIAEMHGETVRLTAPSSWPSSAAR